MTLHRTCLLVLPALLATMSLGMTEAAAAPITLSKANAVADARRDVGDGICGSTTHFKTQPQPLSQLGDAVALLNKPANDPNVLGRKSAIFANMNFKVADPSSLADFTLPNFIDDLFPYSADANAMPPGDNSNIAMRLRGYLNVNNTLSGQPVTFGVMCDDACSLTIGKQVIIPLADERLSGRVTQQVIFKDTGLYPVEVVYYQNATSGFFEWSKALSAEAEGNQNSSLDTNKFKIISPADLYSSIIGSNPGCQECGVPGMDCTAGRYCGDGLCQTCATPNHCGPTCQPCLASNAQCIAGACVSACTSGAGCASGMVCNLSTGACVAPIGCTSDSMCTAPQVCRPEGVCGSPPISCQSSASCPSGQYCNPTQQSCAISLGFCSADADCAAIQFPTYCNTALNVCVGKPATGCGCRVPGSSTEQPPGSRWLVWAALLALGLRRLQHRNRDRQRAE